MKRSMEYPQPAQHVHEADAVFDTLGFSGENSGYDSLRSLPALKSFLAESIETDSADDEIGEWLIRMYRGIEAGYGEREGEAASVMLGCVIGKKVMDRSSVGNQEHCKLLIDRTYQNVALAREAYGWGNDGLFYGALLEMACTAPGIYDDRQHMKHVRGLVRYAAAHQSRLERRQKRETGPAKAETGASWRGQVIYALGIVGMMHGAMALPRPEQRYDNREERDD